MNQTKYKITIEKIEEVTKVVRGEWTRVSDTGPNPFGYTPDREAEVKVETTILEQTVEELDLKAVLKAINGL